MAPQLGLAAQRHCTQVGHCESAEAATVFPGSQHPAWHGGKEEVAWLVGGPGSCCWQVPNLSKNWGGWGRVPHFLWEGGG